MRIVRTITTPWAPYSVMFSRDGTRLAIGGGSWYGNGGILLVSLDSGATQLFSCEHLPGRHAQREGVPTVSGVCFSPDDRHLAASTWSSGHRPGPTFLFEVSGLDLKRRETLGHHFLDQGRGGCPTGVLFFRGHTIARNNRVGLTDVLSVWKSSRHLHLSTAGDFLHLTSSRVVIAKGRVITGSDAGIVSGPLVVNSRDAELLPMADGWRVTAIGALPSGDGFLTGGLGGELDAWSWNERWVQHRLRPETNMETFPDPELDITWATYRPDSIVGICHLAEGDRWVSVSAGGVVCLWVGSHLATTWKIPEAGSPRSLAAHPDRPWIAVGVKKGGFARPQSAVVIAEVGSLQLDPAWRTPTVLALARAAEENSAVSAGPLAPFLLAILADALEEAGCTNPRILGHLRSHHARLRTCWVVDALLGKS